MANLPEIKEEQALRGVIEKLSRDRTELLAQVSTLELLSNALLEQRDSALSKVSTLESRLPKEKPLQPDDIEP